VSTLFPIRGKSGFTLAEVSIAAAIQVVAIALAMAGLIYVFTEMKQMETQVDLDMDVQIAMERVKGDLRLSSVNEMFFYPSGSAGPYSAMSFPAARDDNNDGALEVDADGNIIWDQTLVYHVWSGEPNQLRLTIFDPRDSSLTDEQRQEQLNAVVTAGEGSGTHNGANASTRVVFENLFDWKLQPQSAIYDAYSPSLSRDRNVVLGACVLSNGMHSFKFKVVGQNDASSGRKVGIDSLFVSPSYSRREAEAQLPASSYYGALPTRQYMAGGSWGGNFHLYFPASSDGAYFTLNMANDRWEETNFDLSGGQHDNTTVSFDTLLNPWDFVVHLAGLQVNWYAYQQTGDTNGASASHDAFLGTVSRVIARGEDIVDGGWILTSGEYCAVRFRAANGVGNNFWIKEAYIGECADTTNGSPDVVAGTMQPLTFSALTERSITGGTAIWCDPIHFPVEKEKSYAITFRVGTASGDGNPYRWQELISTNAVGCYTIARSNVTVGVSAQATWSSLGAIVEPKSCVYGVEALWATYPTNGYYTSPPFDTTVSAPSYTRIDWSADLPTDTAIEMKVRSGSDAGMSDAVAWSNASAMASPGVLSIPALRFVQFQSRFVSGNPAVSTPKLKDVTIGWPGEARVVDVGGTITKGPDYGIFELTVDGKPLRTGVTIDLEIFRDARGHGQTRRFTSRLKSEIRPRNGGT
jgi:hypothetical protein